MSKPKTRCSFCGELGATKGHIWPDWFNKVLPQKSTHHEQELGKFSTFDLRAYPLPHAKKIRQGSARSRKPRNTCSACNGGWMSRIEGSAIPFATPLILGNQLSVIPPYGQRTVAAFLSLMAMRLEFTGVTRAVSQEDRDFLRHYREPSNRWKIWLATYVGEKPEEHWSKNYAMLFSPEPTDVVTPDKCNVYVSTMVIGKLCAHMFYSYIIDFPGYNGVHLAQIWPPGQFDLGVGFLPRLVDEQVVDLHEAFARENNPIVPPP
jgi:hypothetical protein